MRKIINITIFAIAGLAALLAVLFGVSFNQDAQDKFRNTVEVKANNPQMLTDLVNATVETLPTFVAKYEGELATRNAEVKKQKIQRDIFYTFIFHLDAINSQETFDEFKANFPEYSRTMFALADDKDFFINGFNKVNSFSEFQHYFERLNASYEEVRQNFLSNANAVKAETNLLKQVSDINAAISIVKKEYDLKELQKNIRSYKTESTQFNMAMNLFYLLFFTTFAAMIIFLLWGIFVNIKGNIGMLIGVGLLVLLVIIGFFTSSPELSPSAVKMQLDANNVKLIGAGLFTFYCMFFGAIAAILITVTLDAIKKTR